MLDKLSKEQEELMYKHRRDFIDFIVNNGKHQPKDLTLTKELRADIDCNYNSFIRVGIDCCGCTGDCSIGCWNCGCASLGCIMCDIG